MTERDIVILSAIDWNFTWQRHQIISSYFARHGFRVIFVNGTMIKNPDLKSIRNVVKKYRRKFMGGVGRKEYSKPENVHVVNSFVLPSTFGAFRMFNKFFLLGRLLRKINSYRLRSPVVIWYIPNRTTLEIVHHLKPRLTVYDCVSNYTGLKGVPRDTEKIERELIDESDVLVADADFLVHKLQQRRNGVHQIMPGVDYDLFSRADSGLVKHVKTVCYFGGIRDDRIDIELLLNLAETMRDRRFLFIGPVNSELPDFPSNVSFVGRVPHENLPSYLKECDCIIFPYRINEFTKGIIPAKFYESFATGKPVIATPLPNFMPFREVMVLAGDHSEFVRAIDKIEEVEDQEKYEKRLLLARQNSWELQCGKFLDLIRAGKNNAVSSPVSQCHAG